MFKASSIANTIIVLFPFLMIVPLIFAINLQNSQPSEIIIFYLLGGLIATSFMIYAKYPAISNGQYSNFGLRGIPKERKWAYILSYMLVVFLAFVSLLAIGLSK